MRSLSFFYRRTNLSGRVRRQVAERLGAKINPTGDVSEDVCIGVKMSPGLIAHDKLITRMGVYYLDFIDHHTSIRWLRHWPDIRIIVASRSAEQWLGANLRNPLWFIPQQHCNVEGWIRPDRPVRVVGFIGSIPERLPWMDQMDEGVRRLGLEMRWVSQYQDRWDVVQALKQIDIHFGWREGLPEKLLWTKNPMKIFNAGSFRIPTVARREPAYDLECPDVYLPALTIPEALDQIAALRDDPTLYATMAERAHAASHPYHLDRIAELFRSLAAETP